MLPLSTTLETLLAHQDRADSRPSSADALDAWHVTFEWQRRVYQWKKRGRDRFAAFAQLFDVDADASMTPELSDRLQRHLFAEAQAPLPPRFSK
jgi:hypothetical protein